MLRLFAYAEFCINTAIVQVFMSRVYNFLMDSLASLLGQVLQFLLTILTLIINFVIAILSLILNFAQALVGSVS